MPDHPTMPAGFADDFIATLARPDCTAHSLLALVAAHLIETCDLRLVTIAARDTNDGTFLRLFSSMPDAYAAQGRKPVNETDWSRHVIDEHKTFIANDYEEVKAAMFDHEQIRALGCESLVNVPVVVCGDVVGTLNCLSVSGHFDDAIVAACEAMRLPVAAALLLQDE
ncbi:GAF domain-containing protein [Pelagovum pacificum]|uniref:GAF domain-containing protein n=1 Tax=Pelagovum pacificum TaxID=2588711 RepID=A0A5C5GF01_9RHOB|nr:GAF domain-containing protein [Pelagovum pacificum]QQA43576.1 GAF domain-containing protein [Pelagovum pacificum]TNY33288.1 GAF domain-containing protein [Pelagovum pacificum]